VVADGLVSLGLEFVEELTGDAAPPPPPPNAARVEPRAKSCCDGGRAHAAR
jgi:hypothetical protein